MFPNTGCDWDIDGKDEVVAVAEVNENMELDDIPVDNPNTIGALLVATIEVDDAPNENPVDGDDELATEPMTGDLLVCQLELKMLEVAALVELIVLASEEEVEEQRAKVVPELNGFAAGTDEPITELLVAKDVIPEVPKTGDDPDEPNWKGML